MIEVKADEEALKKITEEIGNLPYKAPNILRDASNETGKYAMKRLQEGIRERYVYKDSAINLKEHLRRKSASYQNPRTIINAVGSMTDITDFEVSPRRLSRGANRVGPYTAHVVRSHSPVTMSNRTFMVQFENGHIALVKRVPGKQYSKEHIHKRRYSERLKRYTLDTTKIEAEKSPSVSHMSNVVYGENEDEIGARLQRNLKKHTDKFIKRSNG
jgi:hypothetical protein